jgi:uncharacterized protein
VEVDCMPVADGDARLIVYRPVGRLAFVGNRALADIALAASRGDSLDDLSASQSEAVDFLRSIGFLEPDPDAPSPPAGGFTPTTAVLLLTNRCQLRCTYCYASAGELPRAQLSVALGRAAIERVAEFALALGRPRFEVAFHGGGEPTLAWRTLKTCTDYARRQPVRANVTLTSNGVWSREQIAWIAENLDGLSLSVDGDPATQDGQRPFASGGGSSGQVMRSLAELDRRSFQYGIRMTATAPWAELPERVRFLCENTGCRSIQVEPSFKATRGGHGQPTRVDGYAFADAFLEAHDLADRAGRRLYCSGARLGVVSSTFCSAPYSALIVNALGHLVACYEVSGETHPLYRMSVIGHLEGGQVVVHEAARSHLHGLMADRRASCRDCFCYWTCAGDCYTRTFAPGPEGHLRRGVRCEVNRRITRELLLRGIAAGGGVWRGSKRIATPSGSAPATEVGASV